MLTYEVDAYLTTNSGPVGFPLMYGGFDALAVRLHAPLQRYLRAGVPQLFRLEVPNASEVLIANNGAMTSLQRTGALFAGEVVLRPGEVQVAVRLPNSGASLDVVLAYQAQ